MVKLKFPEQTKLYLVVEAVRQNVRESSRPLSSLPVRAHVPEFPDVSENNKLLSPELRL